MELRTIAHLEKELETNEQSFEGKTILIRVDYNVPMNEKREITDHTRIVTSFPTIQYFLEQKAKIVLCAHLGRPKGTKNPKLSLQTVGEYLADKLDLTILFCDVMEEPSTLTRELKSDQIVLLENLRFHPGEKANDKVFASKLGLCADFYINDAFGVLHRKAASVHALPKIFPRSNKAVGLLVEKEYQALEKVLQPWLGKTVAVIGGAKVSDKIIMIENFSRRCSDILIGGAMAYTFLAAKGEEVGKSRIENDKIQVAKEIITICKKRGVNLHLPIDHIGGATFAEDAEPVITDILSEELMGLDIGPKTLNKYSELIKEAACVFWNGPMGVFEWENYSAGTKGIAEALSECDGYTVVGGGDSAAAVVLFELADKMNHVSTGGGASLALLEGSPLPGLDFLQVR
tara:strand:- start:16 stop:1224 length:1209 start_codon:yes stop_codon:yes gene_type:complete